MEILAVALMFCAGIWGGIFLVMNNHPYFAVLVFIITASIRYSSKFGGVPVTESEKE